MPTACSANGCTYRHKKGDYIGMYCFPKDKYLCQLWTIAIKRANWKPSPSSRICGKHFHSGRPSKDKDNPDYVPSIFVFNGKKNTIKKENAQDEAFQKVGEHLIKPAPFIHFARRAEPIEGNDNVENNISVSSSNNKSFLLNNEIRPTVPQHVWIHNFIPAKEDSDMPVKIASVSSLNKNHSTSVPNSSEVCENNELFCVESSVTVDDDGKLNTYSDKSTLAVKSSIPDDDAMSLQAKPYVIPNEDSEFCNVESSVAANENSAVCKVESSMIDSKGSVISNVDIDDTSESMTNDTVEDIPSSTTKSTKETSECDYSNFMWSHLDSKEVLAIKLETMIAINISLREKVKFYQNRCKLYENEINNLKKFNEKSPTVVVPKLKKQN